MTGQNDAISVGIDSSVRTPDKSYCCPASYSVLNNYYRYDLFKHFNKY